MAYIFVQHLRGVSDKIYWNSKGYFCNVWFRKDIHATGLDFCFSNKFCKVLSSNNATDIFVWILYFKVRKLNGNKKSETFAKLASVAHFFVVRCSKTRLTCCYVFVLCATAPWNALISTSFANVSVCRKSIYRDSCKTRHSEFHEVKWRI